MANIFKFRNLFCLIHKLYIALVKKKKTKTKKTKNKKNPKQNSENKTLFQSLGPSSFSNTRVLKLYIPIGRIRQNYEWSHDISKNKIDVTEGSFLGLVNCLNKKTQQNRMKFQCSKSTCYTSVLTHSVLANSMLSFSVSS